MNEQEQTAMRTSPTESLQDEHSIRAEAAAEQRPVEQDKEVIRLDPVLESPRFKGRRICYQRCPNMGSENIVTCEHCRHQYHIECLGATPEDVEDGVIRCEFCPDFEETERVDEEQVERREARENPSENRCPCGEENFLGPYVECHECRQAFHAQCVDVQEEDARKPFVCWSCDVFRRMEEQHSEVVRDRDKADSCPCGQRTPLSRLLRCRTCNQAYHRECDDGRLGSNGHFTCSACVQEALADELTARNLALRENYDQAEILRGLKLPKVSSRGAEHAKRLLQSHLQRMAGEESFAFETTGNGSTADSFFGEKPLCRPVPKPRQSLAKSRSLRDRLTADVEIGTGDSLFRSAEERPSVKLSQGIRPKSSENTVVMHPRREPPRDESVADYFQRIQTAGKPGKPQDRLVNRTGTTTAMQGSQNGSGEARDKGIVTVKSLRNAYSSCGRAPKLLTVNKLLHSDSKEATRQSGQSNRSEKDALYHLGPGPEPNRPLYSFPGALKASPVHFGNNFEAVTVENRTHETTEKVNDLQQELNAVRARLRNLTFEHEKLKNSRHVSQSSKSQRNPRRVSYFDDHDSTIPAPRLTSTRMDDLIGNENVQHQHGNDELDDQCYLRPRAAVNRHGGAVGNSGNQNVANAGLGEMGKAFLTLAQQLSELQKSNRYATGLNNLKVLKGTEGSDAIRRYFREFELMTNGWSEQERVEALNVKLEDRARLTLSSMPAHLQNVYSAVKAEILERLANDESKRVTKLSELMTGKPRKPSEPIIDFGERVLKLVRDACDPSVPSKQLDEIAKAYFLTYVNDKELIASLTEKQDELEFRYLVDHAAALRANLDRFRRIASEASSNQQVQAVPQSSQPPSQQQNLPNPANRVQGNVPQQQRLNPYRTDLRYQGFPPAKGTFQTQVSLGKHTSNAAADVVQPQGSNVFDESSSAQISPATPPNCDLVGSCAPAPDSEWWFGESSYSVPRPRIRRRRRRKPDSDIGNSYTGRDDLLGPGREGEDKEPSVPTVNTCAAAATETAPFCQSKVPACAKMPEEEKFCVAPHPDSVVSGEPVVETQDGEFCSWLTSNNASPTTIGEDQVVGIADPVEEISPCSNIIATDVLEEVTAQRDPPAPMQKQETFGPNRNRKSNGNTAKVLPVDKPLAESLMTPSVRSWPIPVEVPLISPLSVTVEPNVTEVEKEVRPGAVIPLVASPLNALAPLGDKALTIFALPPTAPQSTSLDALIATVRSFTRVQLFGTPPPPKTPPPPEPPPSVEPSDQQQNRLRSVVHVPTRVGLDNIQLIIHRKFRNRHPAAVNRSAPADPGPPDIASAPTVATRTPASRDFAVKMTTSEADSAELDKDAREVRLLLTVVAFLSFISNICPNTATFL